MIKNYNKSPIVRVREDEKELYLGWQEIIPALKDHLQSIPGNRRIIAVECYQGVHEEELLDILKNALRPTAIFRSSAAFKPEEMIRRITQSDVTNDRIFGYMTRLEMEDFFDLGKVENVRMAIRFVRSGDILLFGPGISLVFPSPDILIYADMARWEIQLRMRRNEVSNLGISNLDENIEGKYKRGYFVDWRICDRLKRRVLRKCDWVLDTNRRESPAMISGVTFFDSLDQVVQQPFSVVPYFDAGPWGGQWMKDRFDLDPEMPNSAWCFNCVPEENSLYLGFGDRHFETPSINLVLFHAMDLLGGYVQTMFGDEFPIRFDFLDTMGGGNLSLQVHPLTKYIRDKFGVTYTQDESYYLVDASEGAQVFLGLKEDIDSQVMIRELKDAQMNGTLFDDTRFVQSWPAKKHDHFLIPGGTIHCSGKDCMVLEISATPYIFTFKLWDWGRMGLDGRPRPINIDHGVKNIQWNRTEMWVRNNLVNRFELRNEGDGWIEEKTGLHDLEFIETHRHTFVKPVTHHTNEGVNVIALVEGSEIIIESPTGKFTPFPVHYAETFIVPATVGEYTIRPADAEHKPCITIKAFIRKS